MKYGIIVGSHRGTSNSMKVAKYLERRLKARCVKDDVYILSLAPSPVPLWDESMWEASSALKDQWRPYSDELKGCDAVIVISPEWSGMVPAALKNLFLYCTNDELSHKPGLIVAVSSGTGGAYPVAELRMSSYKNTRLCYIPEHVIVRQADDVLNDADQAQSVGDQLVRDRIDYALGILEQYGKALGQVRESGAIDHKNFRNGM